MFWEVKHTADKAIFVETLSIENLFYESALGLNTLFADELSKNKIIIEEKYENNAIDYETLLVEFLNFIIYKRENGFQFICSNIKINDFHLYSVNYFRKINKKKISIKSATFHNLNIIKRYDLYTCEIVFDV
ncbi:MAG: archease [Candidatus Kapaibacteriales bacterium]